MRAHAGSSARSVTAVRARSMGSRSSAMVGGLGWGGLPVASGSVV